MNRRRVLKIGLLNLLLAWLPVTRARLARYVERDGWILRSEDR